MSFDGKLRPNGAPLPCASAQRQKMVADIKEILGAVGALLFLYAFVYVWRHAF